MNRLTRLVAPLALAALSAASAASPSLRAGAVVHAGTDAAAGGLRVRGAVTDASGPAPAGGPVTVRPTLIALLPAPACPADLNADGRVNVDDLEAFVNAFLAADPLADLDGNSAINVDDLEAFVQSFLAGCSQQP